MDTDLPDLPDDIDVSRSALYSHQQYWCVVEKREGKWLGYVGSSGKGNQRTKYAAFTIFRPVHSNDLVSVLFEFLTNQHLFNQFSRRTYKFVLATLKQLLDTLDETEWKVNYRNRKASLYLKEGRKIGLKVAGTHNLILNIDDWKPSIVDKRVFQHHHFIKESFHA
ncbi:hypothetical protein [Photobacterium phage PDCC-1]|uniref:Uncharacterized protein n=1 Tax=Photobacterium phage PDCC-1 TaxID=2664246 RepID=A0A6B9J888_9CAUD|nr:hypothetical protein HWC77_gp118 [Photobacterium phage PDCC-1]QGZ14481.1 hypothetical protein [Photobacterium phage PDCC-1]